MIDPRAFAVLATDIAVLTCYGAELKVLLTKAHSKNFKGEPVLPGGLVEFSERTDEAAKRILGDVLKSTVFYTEQLYTFDDPDRDPAGRVVSVAYIMLIPWKDAVRVIKSGASWHSVKDLPRLAYDHNEIIKLAVKRLVGKITYTNIIFNLMPEEFTLTELQDNYEIILGRKLDKRNFRKKLNSLNLLRKLPRRKEGEANRPAHLFSFRQKSIRELAIL
jgi:8-oxo-dGTP diphosphatase